MTPKAARKAANRAQRQMEKRDRLLRIVEKAQGKPQHHDWGEHEYFRSPKQK